MPCLGYASTACSVRAYVVRRTCVWAMCAGFGGAWLPIIWSLQHQRAMEHACVSCAHGQPMCWHDAARQQSVALCCVCAYLRQRQVNSSQGDSVRVVSMLTPITHALRQEEPDPSFLLSSCSLHLGCLGTSVRRLHSSLCVVPAITAWFQHPMHACGAQAAWCCCCLCLVCGVCSPWFVRPDLMTANLSWQPSCTQLTCGSVLHGCHVLSQHVV